MPPAAEARAASLPGGAGDRRLDGKRPAAEFRHHDDGPHAGLTARDAVHAALLAEKGFLSDTDALDGKYGFFNLFAGAPPKALPLGQPFELVQSGIIFKPYPRARRPMRRSMPRSRCMPGSATACTKWRASSRLVHPWNFMTLREGVPSDTLRARVSMRYCVAAALRFGALGSPSSPTKRSATRWCRSSWP